MTMRTTRRTKTRTIALRRWQQWWQWWSLRTLVLTMSPD